MHLIGFALHFDGMRIGKLRGALKNLDAVAAELRTNDFRFAGNDGLRTRKERSWTEMSFLPRSFSP